MKQRITYLVMDPDSFTPEQLDVKGGSLTLKGVQAVKEHRITFNLDELARELTKAFEQCTELHIRWASSKPYTAVPPFTSRVTPGLHVFFEPRKTQSKSNLCGILHSTFGSDLKCPSMEEAATKLSSVSNPPPPTVSSQYYSYLPTLTHLVSYIQKTLCNPSSKSCKEGAESLLCASYFDIDYDTTSSTLVISAFWDSPNKGSTWTEHIPAPSTNQTVEVGVLTHERNPDPEDIAFGGFLTVLGRDTSPKPTRFQTPTRHYPLPATTLTYTTSFVHPIGLHPTLHLTFPSATLTPPNPTCKLHTHLTLPSYIFIDKYQFSDALFLSSHNLVSLRQISGATDLEAPDWVVPQWGSTALFELASPSASSLPPEWNVSIPMHLRYLPASPSSHAPVPVPWPVVFWACHAEQEMSASPFDREHLGYEAWFGRKTRFMHVPPADKGNGTGGLVQWIDVPVLDTTRAGWVETGTIGVVLFAFLGLCWVLGRDMGGRTGEKERAAKKKQ